MGRALLIATCLALAGAAASSAPAGAQPCLTLSDGSGNTTVSCPDGRTGLLHTDPAGGVSGMIGGQVYQGVASSPELPHPLPGGAPSTSYLIAPAPPSLAGPPPAPAPLASLPPLPPETNLTQLQQEYQAEQASLRARRAAAEQAAKRASESGTSAPAPLRAAAAPR